MGGRQCSSTTEDAAEGLGLASPIPASAASAARDLPKARPPELDTNLVGGSDPPRFLFLPSPWSSPSLANPAVKCLGAFHSFPISSAVFANSFVTSPSDVFCTANELPCHMFPRDRLPRNCPVFFYCQQSTHTVRAPARLDSMPRFMRWPHKRKMAIG